MLNTILLAVAAVLLSTCMVIDIVKDRKLYKEEFQRLAQVIKLSGFWKKFENFKKI